MRLNEFTNTIDEEEFEKIDAGFGMSEYQNSRYVLAGGFRSGNSSAGTTRLKYMIYDLELYAKTNDQNSSEIGFVELFVEDKSGEIVGLVNIELKPKFRKGGHGAKIIQDIKDTTSDGFNVHDIQKKPKKFWDKQGTEYTNRGETDGRINK